MKLNNKQINKYLNFVNTHKDKIGLTDWRIFIKLETKELDEIANVEADEYNKIMNIALSNKYLKLTDREQMNTLFHEMLHSRFEIMQNFQAKGDNEYFEELFINDVVRGFERHKEFEWEE